MSPGRSVAVALDDLGARLTGRPFRVRRRRDGAAPCPRRGRLSRPRRAGGGAEEVHVSQTRLFSSAAQATSSPAVKPAWRFARERRLGRVARELLDVAEARMPSAVSVLGPE